MGHFYCITHTTEGISLRRRIAWSTENLIPRHRIRFLWVTKRLVGHATSKILNRPSLCDDLCANVIPWLAVVRAMMVAYFLYLRDPHPRAVGALAVGGGHRRKRGLLLSNPGFPSPEGREQYRRGRNTLTGGHCAPLADMIHRRRKLSISERRPPVEKRVMAKGRQPRC
jgi:hypothetical protein